MFGVILGLISSAAFGLIPLFTIPLLAAGISIETALVYRFGVAAAAMFTVLLLTREKLAVAWQDLAKLGFLSGFYLFAVVAYFHSFTFLPSSIAATIQFLYPLMVMLIMIAFFHEKFNWRVALAVGLGVAGVAFLSAGAGNEPPEPGLSRTFWGVILSLTAGLGNSLYMVGIQVARFQKMTGALMTFYVMLFGTVYSLANALFCNSLQWIDNWRALGLASLLALVTAVLSNLTLIMSIKRVGSTIAAILGVMEPLTAVFVGIFIFGEAFSLYLAGGVALILCSVSIAILIPKQKIPA